MAGYHKADIKRGEYGQFSKIKEEFLEAEDAYEQENKLMLLIELSDLIGAIEEFITQYNMELEDLLIMKDATKRAFRDGSRK